MEFHVYHDQMVFAKAAAYILMAVALVCAVGWWKFLTGKEPRKNTNHDYDDV